MSKHGITKEELVSRIIDFKQATTETLIRFASQRLGEAVEAIFAEGDGKSNEEPERLEHRSVDRAKEVLASVGGAANLEDETKINDPDIETRDADI